MPQSADNYAFFWKTNEVHGWGSQWYPSPFKATITFPTSSEEEPTEPEKITFPTAEHYMMLQKALLFNDVAIARANLATSGTSQSTMAAIKALGRKASGFNEAVWLANRERIVLEGNLLKFRQNEELREKLLATGQKRIVEASPRDRIWGVGFGEKNALNQKDRWGLNLLGKALEDTRGILREELQVEGK